MDLSQSIFGWAWLIPALPLASFLVVGLFLRTVSPRASGLVATLSVAATAVLSLLVAREYLATGAGQALTVTSFEWLRFQPGLSVTAGVLLDPISVMLLVVVTSVSTLVHIYSLGYMHGEPGFGRYFAYLNLFTFSMLGLVIAPSVVQMYVFWELVGASSFLLIGFYYDKPSAVAASKKAFIVTRFADLGFLLGVLLLGYFAAQAHPLYGAGTQAFDFSFLTGPTFVNWLAQQHLGPFPALPTAMLLLFMGAAGKSAMFPLHIWLPDAMEGPTPVSALIHAATMVVAGVYLVARMFPAFAAAPDALAVIAVVGAFTCLFAAFIGAVQDDIKRVLAYSTLSQLGYMMLALGVSSPERDGYGASMFHLFTHAFFKALLFLGAGSVIHAAHTNDMWRMGGLRKKMPVTHLSFLIATLAIAGIWPFAGFFSKDAILAAALHNGHPVIFAVGLGVAGLTAFYMFRVYFVTFGGVPRTHEAEHGHEAPFTMQFPLMVLALASIGAGLAPIAAFVGGPAHEGIDLAIAVPATAMALVGIGAAWAVYGRGAAAADPLQAKLGAVHTALRRRLYVDEVYLFLVHKVIFRFIAAPISWFDRNAVDGAVNLAAQSTLRGGNILTRLQTGRVQTYAAWLAGGAISTAALLWAAHLLR